MIKTAIVLMVSLFTKLFNFILKHEYFPKDWCRGFIIPIFKSGDQMNPSNYRGITISSCFGKVFTGIMNQRLVNFASSQNIFVDEQIGFMKNCRTADHIFVLKTLLEICKTKKDSLFCCFVDFRKAFDLVWRNGLFYKLLEYNVSSKFVHILQSMYSQLQSRVRTNEGYCSHFFNSQVGTRQGCNLSPTLFNLYLNDFPKLLTGCDPIKMGSKMINILMYADDIVLVSKSSQGLQKALDILHSYCHNWRISLNLQKTKIMIFNKKKLSDKTFHFGCETISECNSYNYLGILITPNGSFKTAVKNLENKARKAWFSVKGSLQNLGALPVPTVIKLFDNLVKPILLYGSEVWGLWYITNTKSIDVSKIIANEQYEFEKLHTKFCKQSLLVHKKTNNMAARSEMGRYPLVLSVILSCINYFFYICTKGENSLVFQALKTQLSNTNSQYVNVLKKIFQYLNINDYNIYDARATLQNLQENYESIYHDYMSSHTKLKIFNSIKRCYSRPKYLDIVKSSDRCSLTKLRLSAHSLPIEIGRYKNIDQKNRFCDVCDSKCIGDEYHLLFNCSNQHLVKLRDIFLKQIYNKCDQLKSLPTYQQFLYLMSAYDVSVIETFCNYVNKILACYSDQK